MKMKWDYSLIHKNTTYKSYRKALKKKNQKKNKPSGKTIDIRREISILRKGTYADFLKSDYWKRIRKQILVRDKYTCTNCGSKKHLEVHHTTYKHHFAEHKHLGDLHTLCRTCHKEIHLIQDIH